MENLKTNKYQIKVIKVYSLDSIGHASPGLPRMAESVRFSIPQRQRFDFSYRQSVGCKAQGVLKWLFAVRVCKPKL